MNRRKSNVMSNTHGAVDINSIMRANRGSANASNENTNNRQPSDQ